MPQKRINAPEAAGSLWLNVAVALAFVALVAAGAGCRAMQSVVDLPVRAVTQGNKNAPDPVEMQSKLLRFTDQFAAQMISGIDKLRIGTNQIDPAEALRFKIVLVTDTCAIASGPNTGANLLDMTVLVTMTRLVLEQHWQPKVYGDSAQPLLESCRRSETNIWTLVGRVLTSEQQEELRRAIVEWQRQNPNLEKIMGSRAVGFATEVAQARKTESSSPASVFRFLGIDPLTSLDPATREIAQTRIFAERALYLSQWMPTLLRWQIELMSLHTAALPEVQQLVTNTTQLAGSVGRFARVAEQLPQQFSHEREEIIKALQEQEKGLTTLAGEFQRTLATGTHMSTSLNATITSFDGLMKRFGVGETNRVRDSSTNATPFRVLDYAQTATQLESAARQLTELLRQLDQTTSATNLAHISAQLSPVVQQAQTSGKELVDYAFWKALLFVVLVLVIALIYRWLAARIASANKSPKTNL